MPSGIYKKTPQMYDSRRGINQAEHVCPICKNIFYDYKSQNRIACSKKCSTKRGELHPAWKGNKTKDRGLHERVESTRGKPKFCEVCETDDKEKRYEWANLTGNYLDIMDFKRMCVDCHRKYDQERGCYVRRKITINCV